MLESGREGSTWCIWCECRDANYNMRFEALFKPPGNMPHFLYHSISLTKLFTRMSSTTLIHIFLDLPCGLLKLYIDVHRSFHFISKHDPSISAYLVIISNTGSIPRIFGNFHSTILHTSCCRPYVSTISLLLRMSIITQLVVVKIATYIE